MRFIGSDIPMTNDEVAAIDAELEARRRLTEREEAEMQRQRELLQAQLQLATAVQADLDILKGHNTNRGPSSTEMHTSGPPSSC